jgi:fructose-1,6-bisphosphatase I
MSAARAITLGEYLIENQEKFPYAKGDLTALLSAIRLAAKVVNREINKAGITDILGNDTDSFGGSR